MKRIIYFLNPDFAIGFEENGLTLCQDKSPDFGELDEACEQKNRRRIRCNTARTLLRVRHIVARLRQRRAQRSHSKEVETFYRTSNANSGLMIVTVLVIAVTIFIKPIIISLAKNQFQRVFIASTVSIRECEFKPFRQLSLSDVEIKRADIYNFTIKELNLQYNLLSLFQRRILKVSLRDGVVDINLPKESILKINQYLNLSSSCLFSLETLALFNLSLNLNTQDLDWTARVSMELSLAEQLIDSLDVKIDSLSGQNIRLEEAFLKSDRKQTGDFSVQRLQYDKFKIANIKSKVGLTDKKLVLDSLSAQTLNGEIQGNLTFKMDNPPEYAANLKIKNIDLERVVNDFNFNEKFQMTGGLNGSLVINGRGTNINILTGYFSSAGSGGTLTIKDTQFLEQMALDANQYLDIVVESFQNYRYNKGVIRLSLEQGNLILNAALDAEAGKRNLNIILHDFKLPKE